MVQNYSKILKKYFHVTDIRWGFIKVSVSRGLRMSFVILCETLKPRSIIKQKDWKQHIPKWTYGNTHTHTHIYIYIYACVSLCVYK